MPNVNLLAFRFSYKPRRFVSRSRVLLAILTRLPFWHYHFYKTSFYFGSRTYKEPILLLLKVKLVLRLRASFISNRPYSHHTRPWNRTKSNGCCSTRQLAHHGSLDKVWTFLLKEDHITNRSMERFRALQGCFVSRVMSTVHSTRSVRAS